MDAMTIVSPIISLIGGGLAGGALSLYFNRRYYLRKMRTELYPHLEKMIRAYEIRALLPEGKGWIVDGRRYHPGPSDDDFRADRRDFISRLVGFNELKEARELRGTMISSTIPLSPEDGFPTAELAKEVDALSQCFKTIQEKLRLEGSDQ
jgi:hypothetical protein